MQTEVVAHEHKLMFLNKTVASQCNVLPTLQERCGSARPIATKADGPGLPISHHLRAFCIIEFAQGPRRVGSKFVVDVKQKRAPLGRGIWYFLQLCVECKTLDHTCFVRTFGGRDETNVIKILTMYYV